MSKPKRKLGENTLSRVNTLVMSLPDLLAREDHFAFTYQRELFLSKYVDNKTDPAELRRSRAIVKWLRVELRNRKTNDRLLTHEADFKGIGQSWQVLRQAAKFVRKVIGVSPPEGLLSRGSFSGGASTSVKRSPVSSVAKFGGVRDVTQACWDLLCEEEVFKGLWAELNPEAIRPRIVLGNVLFTVPKTSVIDRVAAKEPDYNIFCQKAVGDFIRSRLRKRAQIDLNDQSINQKLAREGSVTGKLATIDLSSASDSLTYALVNCLLPREWFLLLDALRSPITFIDGHPHVNEMFSSMGNGFTFELESLVFWALAKATCYLSGTRGRVSVYGDDIIVPAAIASGFLHVLNWCGFTANVKKTFIRGPFRESCGGHYYRGLDITPFFHRKPIGDISDLILFLNQFRAWIIRIGADCCDDGWSTANEFVRLWYALATYVPRILWGGWSLESRVQLASPHKQQCELLPKVRRLPRLKEAHQLDAYLSCQLALERRSSDADPGLPFDPSLPTGEFGIRRCRFEPEVFGLVKPRFITEQD